MKARGLYGPIFLFVMVGILGFLFAMTEIQIEGAGGWAANLPTWRIEKHPILDILWEGKPVTGYHVWVFSFMAVVFHLPIAIYGRFSLRTEVRCIGSLMFFWIIEDLLWFVLNPAFGLARLKPQFVPWHKTWFLGFPLDYTVFGFLGALLMIMSFMRKRKRP